MKNNINDSVIVRFAPSPTGHLHIGGVRTALFNYLFAKQNAGKMILRIEDTDKERSKLEYEKSILDSFKWLGIEFDEIHKQSERNQIYKDYLKKMIDGGYAYVSKEIIQKDGDKDQVIRFKNPKKKITINDLILGDVIVDTTDLGDFIIAKDLDTPLYHLAVVIDDFLMNITHIIRGQEHLANTPRQILIQEAIAAPRPLYAHIPLILATDRSKLSKRHGDTSVKEFKEAGYLPEALLNYLAFLGWNPGTEQELFSLTELINSFDISKIQKGGAVFNVDKLNWFNREYLRKLSDKQFLTEVRKFLPNSKYSDDKMLLKIKNIILDRIFTLSELSDLDSGGEIDYFFTKPVLDKNKINWKDTSLNNTKNNLENIILLLKDISQNDFKKETIKEAIWNLADKEGRGSVLWPMRYALSGKDKSPDPFELAELVGKDETLERLQTAISKLS